MSAEALQLIGEDSSNDYMLLGSLTPDEEPDEVVSQLYYLRGRIFELLENMRLAANWYRDALHKDKFNAGVSVVNCSSCGAASQICLTRCRGWQPNCHRRCMRCWVCTSSQSQRVGYCMCRVRPLCCTQVVFTWLFGIGALQRWSLLPQCALRSPSSGSRISTGFLCRM